MDYVTVTTPDGVTHARVRGVPILLCGRAVPDGSRETAGSQTFDCPDCVREADLRGDRAVGVVDA